MLSLVVVMGGGGRYGLNGYKVNLIPAKLKLPDIGMELSLTITLYTAQISEVRLNFPFMCKFHMSCSLLLSTLFRDTYLTNMI